MTYFKSIFLIFSIGWLSACATSGRNYQQVGIETTHPGVKVYYHGEMVGVTPTFVALERQRKDEIELRDGNNIKKIELRGKYRWGRSFYGNLLFLSYAPVGWVTDLLTEDAYEQPSRLKYDFGESKTSTESNERKKIAIAPPLSIHPNVTDEIGSHITKVLQKKLGPQYNVIDYDVTREQFNDEDVDYDREIDPEDEADLYGGLGVKEIFFSKIDLTGDDVIVRGARKNFFQSAKSEKIELNIKSADIASTKNLVWAGADNKIFQWLPNAVSIESVRSNTDLRINMQEYSASDAETENFLDEVTKYTSALGIRYIRPPSNREGWHYRFAMVPTASLSYNREVFEQLGLLQDLEFTRWHLDAGYGPSFNYGNKKWNFYFNLIPIVSYNQIEASSTQYGGSYSADKTSIEFSTEAGWTYFLGPHWHIRFFAKNAGVDTDLWEDIIFKSTGINTIVDSSTVVISGVSVGYILPSKTFDFFRKSDTN
jgi:hypothetical protein